LTWHFAASEYGQPSPADEPGPPPTTPTETPPTRKGANLALRLEM
jgi:hypothetical protein